MDKHVSPPKLDVKHAGLPLQQLAGQDVLSNYERVMLETNGLGAQNSLNWSARTESRPDAAGQPQVWLHLALALSLPLTCQRCLRPVDVQVEINRDFRFVATEAQAELEDDASEEDLLVASVDFELAALIEDEILLAWPLVSRHEVCPVSLKLAVADADFNQANEKPNPFAALAQLKKTLPH
ncbi:YceD family protein [Rhodoferax sp.]|uniref:YceD family protein n=1 Tax=Rhodoferax sp. TaxID=50421 RepID=UPI00260F99B9|nr:YceD family protein [Rhodoferax sp.]MDD2810955.1 YceD family protein [Rhodoferax sp.]